MRKILSAALLAGAALGAFPASANTVTFYSDETSFLAALGGSPIVEDFQDTTLVPGLSYVSSAGNIGGGLFNDRLVPASQTTTFSFGTNINGFGGYWDLSPGGAGLGIQFNTAPGSTLSMQVPNYYTGQFFGFISSDSFFSLLLTAGTQGGVAETYTLDNAVFGVQQVTGAVPEPASWAMMIGGLAIVGCAMRRRVTNVQFA